MSRPDLSLGTADQHPVLTSLTYTFLFEDFVALNKAAALNGPSRILFWAAYLALITSILLLAIVGTGLWLDGWESLELFERSSFRRDILRGYPAVLLLAALIHSIGQKIQWRWTFKRCSVANKEITLSFSDEGLQSSVSGLEGKASWASIKHVHALKAHLILFISKLEGFVVPHRAFPSNEDFDNFVAYAKERVNG